jgi:SAM-dependent methyltransferase
VVEREPDDRVRLPGGRADNARTRVVMVNEISDVWIATFLDTIPPERTAQEVAFVCEVLPLFTHPRLLDVCCGDGRHARPLALAGYAVTGIDAHPRLIARARQQWRDHDAVAFGPSDDADPRAPVFHVQDARALNDVESTFDGVTCLWSSFGYYDAETNASILRRMTGLLRPGGRVVLDVYHRGFFEAHHGDRHVERAGRRLTESKSVDDGILNVTLRYDDGSVDNFRWQVFTPDELDELAAAAGLEPVLRCAGFDPGISPDPEFPRMQLVYSRVG